MDLTVQTRNLYTYSCFFAVWKFLKERRVGVPPHFGKNRRICIQHVAKRVTFDSSLSFTGPSGIIRISTVGASEIKILSMLKSYKIFGHICRLSYTARQDLFFDQKFLCQYYLTIDMNNFQCPLFSVDFITRATFSELPPL